MTPTQRKLMDEWFDELKDCGFPSLEALKRVLKRRASKLPPEPGNSPVSDADFENWATREKGLPPGLRRFPSILLPEQRPWPE
jgi:hypothetical protein